MNSSTTHSNSKLAILYSSGFTSITRDVFTSVTRDINRSDNTSSKIIHFIYNSRGNNNSNNNSNNKYDKVSDTIGKPNTILFHHNHDIDRGVTTIFPCSCTISSYTLLYQ